MHLVALVVAGMLNWKNWSYLSIRETFIIIYLAVFSIANLLVLDG